MAALLLTRGGRLLPPRLARVRVYGLLFYGAAVLSSCFVSLTYLSPGQWLRVDWLVSAAAQMGLFAYAALALLGASPPAAAVWWPAGLRSLEPLEQLQRQPRRLVPVLLYPAFGALTLLLVQSFDQSILTVLLMLEVVGIFVSSLLLRRQDLRYVALAGIAFCLVRLVFFDLRQSGTIARAVVFILMGLLLLGMNALYARFKDRFGAVALTAEVAAEEPTLPPEEEG
ncbi:DUF2339 domain-containing protein [Hymenobacter sp. HDW8]|uniref:DUF2339 domain-containing protein n=1 Tax=Hymenobacter sp. HDW8 TaxID=2714932 RepID=UPI00140CE79E|nr:DUF2339 domain-containing protein [Hymenobacter sp. HDW8]QIL78297.1 DUF2339 domain-containing protein [Hymenobacter sp. HDW8]